MTRMNRRRAKERVLHLTKEEANQWLQDNKHRIGIPAEIATCKVVGPVKETKGDGHTLEWYRFDSRVKWSEKRGEWYTKQETHSDDKPTTRERGRLSFIGTAVMPTDAERYEETRPMVSRGRIHRKSVGDMGQPEVLTRDERFLKSAAHRQAVKEMKQHGELKPLTVVMGESVPRSMTYDTRRGYNAARRSIGVVMHLADVYPKSGTNADQMVADTRMMEMIAMNDLRELLRSHVTEKELEALEDRACGKAVKDRHCLKRAQTKARPVMAGKVIIRGGFRNKDASLAGPAAWFPVA